MRWISLCRIDPPALAAMCLTLGSLAGTFAGQGPATPAAQSSARGADQALRLRLALDRYHAQYDPVERMLRTPFSSPGYHTRLKGGTVHPTRTSLEYAVALLDTGDDEFKERAVAILRRVIAL